jgi:hypothetical protein
MLAMYSPVKNWCPNAPPRAAHAHEEVAQNETHKRIQPAGADDLLVTKIVRQQSDLDDDESQERRLRHADPWVIAAEDQGG